MRTEILIQLTSYDRQGIQVIMTSTSPWDLNRALLRRVDTQIFVPLPNHETRCLIIREVFTKIKFSKEELNSLSEATRG